MKVKNPVSQNIFDKIFPKIKHKKIKIKGFAKQTS